MSSTPEDENIKSSINLTNDKLRNLLLSSHEEISYAVLIISLGMFKLKETSLFYDFLECG